MVKPMPASMPTVTRCLKFMPAGKEHTPTLVESQQRPAMPTGLPMIRPAIIPRPTGVVITPPSAEEFTGTAQLASEEGHDKEG